jgi:hypothetical protein
LSGIARAGVMGNATAGRNTLQKCGRGYTPGKAAGAAEW